MTPPPSKMKVLDLTQVMAGPFCCQLLADMGADVTKVEPPGTRDQARHAMGFKMKGADTAAFIAINRNRKSITLNLKEEEGREMFYKLAQSSDVLVEELEAVLRTRDTDEWVELFLEAGVPAGPIYNYKQVFEEPQTRAREMVVEMEHPVEGTVRGLGIPVKLSETPGEIRRPAARSAHRRDSRRTGLF
jgi:crotonobetainyl-CoA:carnitine CoA-transferase CaiB-like acyl-CoA transferase